MSETLVNKSYWPHTVYVDEASREDALTIRVLARLRQAGAVNVREVTGSADPLTELGHAAPQAGEAEVFTQGKRQLLLTRYQGQWLRACPGTSQHVCCNLWVVNPGEGCPLDCTYCYLQSYLRRNPTLKLFTNTSDMLNAIELKAAAAPKRLFRICTGEVIDSLVWDDLTDQTLELVPFFAKLPNILLELKTKSNVIGNLLELRNEHCSKTVVSWSVNAPEITEQDEAFTASLSERLAAAAEVADAGYRVGFHFDPLVHHSGWEDGYRETIQRIFAAVKPEQIAWVSVSTLRYRRELQKTMQSRFPDSKLPFGEQFLAKDNKIRYIQPLRFQMLDFVWRELKQQHKALPVYMCMESAAAWRAIGGGPPAAGSELVEVFSRRGNLPVLPAQPAAF